MKFITHFSLGLLITTLLLYIGWAPEVAIFCLIGALAPKLDNVSYLHGLKRRVFHNVWYLLIISMVIAWPGTTLMAISFAVGTLAHLILDIFSKEGLYPLWPQEFVHLELKEIKDENIVLTLAMCTLVAIAVIYLFNDLFFSAMSALATALVINRKYWK
jgi:membrane-bound metal-dependent hydrolase YbcI (DUF457 family)